MLGASCLTAAPQVQAAALRTCNQRRSAGRLAAVVRCEAEAANSRRAVLTGLGLGAAALTLNAEPSLAAYGEPAKVFGSKPENASGFIPYQGNGYALLLPSKWNPSAKQEFGATSKADIRYEDNMYPINSLAVIKVPGGKGSIGEYGSPEKFIAENSYLFGKQVFAGDVTDGSFARGKVSIANVLDSEVAKDKSGREYYKLHTFVRTADGTEGGTHNLIAATVDNQKNLLILKVVIGDKRWYTGAKKFGEGVWNSFTVA